MNTEYWIYPLDGDEPKMVKTKLQAIKYIKSNLELVDTTIEEMNCDKVFSEHVRYWRYENGNLK